MLELILIPFIVSFLIAVFSVPVIIRVANLKNLTDDPDTDRKRHQTNTPTLGGIAIFAGMLVAFSVIYDLYGFSDLKFITPALVILFFAGVKDDLLLLTPWKKLAIQISCAILITYLGNLRITSLWGIFTVQEVAFAPGIFLTVFLMISLINAFNLIDGINGLAGSLGLFASLYFGFWFASNEFHSLTVLSFSQAGALLGFLCFNFNKAKIFMGDTGSMAIGFIIAILAIRFIEANRVNIEHLKYPVLNAPAVTFAVLSIPLFDMIRVFVIRIFKKKSPFTADRNHIHHFYVDNGLSHAKTVLLLLLINISCVLIAIPLNKFRSAWSSLIVFAYLCLVHWLSYSLYKLNFCKKPIIDLSSKDF